MRKLIIQIDSDGVTDALALDAVRLVVGGGKVSGNGDKKQYCYYTTFRDGSGVRDVMVIRNKSGSERFVVR